VYREAEAVSFCVRCKLEVLVWQQRFLCIRVCVGGFCSVRHVNGLLSGMLEQSTPCPGRQAKREPASIGML
jgi:hypothetical protein